MFHFLRGGDQPRIANLWFSLVLLYPGLENAEHVLHHTIP